MAARTVISEVLQCSGKATSSMSMSSYMTSEILPLPFRTALDAAAPESTAWVLPMPAVSSTRRNVMLETTPWWIHRIKYPSSLFLTLFFLGWVTPGTSPAPQKAGPSRFPLRRKHQKQPGTPGQPHGVTHAVVMGFSRASDGHTHWQGATFARQPMCNYPRRVESSHGLGRPC